MEGRRGSPGEQEHGGGGQGVTSVLRAGNTRLHVGLRTCASKVAEDSGLCVDGQQQQILTVLKVNLTVSVV